MRKTQAFVITLLLVAVPVQAGWEEGVAAFTQRNFDQASEEFRQLVEQNPEGYRGHYMLGLSLEQLGRKEEALHHLRKAYDLNPNDLSIKLALGRAYINMRRSGDAAKLLGTISSSEVSQLDSRKKGAFYQMRASAREASGDAGGAFQDYKQLGQLFLQDAKIQLKFGVLASGQNQMGDALTALDRAYRAAPKDKDVLSAYVSILKKKGLMERNNKSARKQVYLKAANLAKELVAVSGSYDNLLLKCETELGASLFEQAIESCKSAGGKKPGDWLAQFYLGQAYSSSKQYVQAETPLNKCTSLTSRPDDLRKVQRQLGFVYEKQRKFSQSIDAYQKAGDQASVTRVRENEKTDLENKRIEEENARIEQMRRESEELEKQMKELEGGGGGGG